MGGGEGHIWARETQTGLRKTEALSFIPSHTHSFGPGGMDN